MWISDNHLDLQFVMIIISQLVQESSGQVQTPRPTTLFKIVNILCVLNNLILDLQFSRLCPRI